MSISAAPEGCLAWGSIISGMKAKVKSRRPVIGLGKSFRRRKPEAGRGPSARHLSTTTSMSSRATTRSSSSRGPAETAENGKKKIGGVDRLDTEWLTEEMILEIAGFLDASAVLTFSQVCRRAWQVRDKLLRDLLVRQHQICLEEEEDDSASSPPACSLSVLSFIKGGTIDCQRATWSSSAGGQSFLTRFLDPNVPVQRLHVSWDGIIFCQGKKAPPPDAQALPWRCVLGWITILKPTSKIQGQIKIVAKEEKRSIVSYINIFLPNPQLLHCKMICYCEAQARSLKGSPHWLFSRPALHHRHSHDSTSTRRDAHVSGSAKNSASACGGQGGTTPAVEQEGGAA